MADFLAAVHLAYIVFAVLGGLLVLRWRWVALLHIPAAMWAALVDYANLPCPLTTWENAALAREGKAGLAGGFVAHYLFRFIYPAGLTRTIEIVLATFVVLVNVAIYAFVIVRSARRRGTPAAGRA